MPYENRWFYYIYYYYIYKSFNRAVSYFGVKLIIYMNDFNKKYIKFVNDNSSILTGLTKYSKLKEFLRMLPRGKVFSRVQIEEYVRLKKLSVPVDALVDYGNDCN